MAHSSISNITANTSKYRSRRFRWRLRLSDTNGQASTVRFRSRAPNQVRRVPHPSVSKVRVSRTVLLGRRKTSQTFVGRGFSHYITAWTLGTDAPKTLSRQLRAFVQQFETRPFPPTQIPSASISHPFV